MTGCKAIVTNEREDDNEVHALMTRLSVPTAAGRCILLMFLFRGIATPTAELGRFPRTSTTMTKTLLAATACLTFFSVELGFAGDVADWCSWRGPLANGS